MNDPNPGPCVVCRTTTGGIEYLCKGCCKAVRAQDPNRPIRHDAVERPQHYTAHPSGVECIQITEHMGFCLGNAVKYIWRASLKGDRLENLRKARWYIEREIAAAEKLEPKSS